MPLLIEDVAVERDFRQRKGRSGKSYSTSMIALIDKLDELNKSMRRDERAMVNDAHRNGMNSISRREASSWLELAFLACLLFAAGFLRAHSFELFL